MFAIHKKWPSEKWHFIDTVAMILSDWSDTGCWDMMVAW